MWKGIETKMATGYGREMPGWNVGRGIQNDGS